MIFIISLLGQKKYCEIKAKNDFERMNTMLNESLKTRGNKICIRNF